MYITSDHMFDRGKVLHFTYTYSVLEFVDGTEEGKRQKKKIKLLSSCLCARWKNDVQQSWPRAAELSTDGDSTTNWNGRIGDNACFWLYLTRLRILIQLQSCRSHICSLLMRRKYSTTQTQVTARGSWEVLPDRPVSCNQK